MHSYGRPSRLLYCRRRSTTPSFYKTIAVIANLFIHTRIFLARSPDRLGGDLGARMGKAGSSPFPSGQFAGKGAVGKRQYGY